MRRPARASSQPRKEGNEKTRKGLLRTHTYEALESLTLLHLCVKRSCRDLQRAEENRQSSRARDSVHKDQGAARVGRAEEVGVHVLLHLGWQSERVIEWVQHA